MKTEFEMYKLKPVPPKWDLQEYIVTYLKEKNEKYLSWFLHYYEPILNKNVEEYMQKLFMPEHFTDMKQAYIMGILNALNNYDYTQNTDFLVFKEHYTERVIFDYVRTMRTGYTAQSLTEYNKLRKAMAIWEKYGRNYSEQTLSKIADEIKESLEDTKQILLGGLLNEKQQDMYSLIRTEDGENTFEYAIPDKTFNTEDLAIKNIIYKRLWAAYEKLSYTERTMLAQRLGFCPECYGVYYIDTTDNELKKKIIKPMMYTDIATDHEYSSANTAHEICKKALDKMRGELKDLV